VTLPESRKQRADTRGSMTQIPDSGCFTYLSSRTQPDRWPCRTRPESVLTGHPLSLPPFAIPQGRCPANGQAHAEGTAAADARAEVSPFCQGPRCRTCLHVEPAPWPLRHRRRGSERPAVGSPSTASGPLSEPAGIASCFGALEGVTRQCRRRRVWLRPDVCNHVDCIRNKG
jgi:hypothetical protein